MVNLKLWSLNTVDMLFFSKGNKFHIRNFFPNQMVSFLTGLEIIDGLGILIHVSHLNLEIIVSIFIFTFHVICESAICNVTRLQKCCKLDRLATENACSWIYILHISIC